MIAGLIMLLVELAILGAILAGAWKVFQKAGRPGWEAIVPIYNTYILTTQVTGHPMLIFILTFVPCANIYAGWVLTQAVAKSFGKSQMFGIGLFLLPMIFIPMLGFGDATYSGPSAPKA